MSVHRTNLRHEFGVIVSHANTLFSAMQALPADEGVMDAAVHRLGPEERAQFAEYLTLLAQRCGTIREHALWVRQHLQFEKSL